MHFGFHVSSFIKSDIWVTPSHSTNTYKVSTCNVTSVTGGSYTRTQPAPVTTSSPGAGGSKSQQELIDILNSVKREEYTMEQAEVLFKEWQLRLMQDNMPKSFKEKKVKRGVCLTCTYLTNRSH